MGPLCRFGLARLEARLERDPDPLGQGCRRLRFERAADRDDLDGVIAPSPAVAAQVALFLAQRPQPRFHGNERYATVRTVYARSVTPQARSFAFDISLDREWVASSALGGTPIRNEEGEWTPEHLVLTALSRCILTSYRYHARRAGHEPTTSAAARGVVTRREEDGRFGFVEIRVDLDVALAAPPSHDDLRALSAKGERDCFVGASLTVKPDYHWTINGEDLS